MPLDRCGDTLARPQNENFPQQTAENEPSLHSAAERSRKGRNRPTDVLRRAAAAARVARNAGGILPSTPQTRRRLQEWEFTPREAHAALAC
jgi:hypothetical protein